jgi:hypothetical protein
MTTSVFHSYTRERLRELALNIATANGMLRSLITIGKPYADADLDYQQAVREFDAALAASFGPNALPAEPTMGMWDDFCAVHGVPFDDFIRAYKNMIDGMRRDTTASATSGD